MGKRVGLKEIAALAGMSVGNVSMVLSGQGDAARISKASQQRVLEAAKQLNYQPNVYAKRLRADNSDHIIIAVFFASTRHVSAIGSFFAGINGLFSDDAFGASQPELVLYPYTQGQLRQLDSIIHQGYFHGAVFMGMSSADFEYMESLDISVPIVAFNRISSHHHYVYMDNASIGRIAAQIFSDDGFQRPYLITSRTVSSAGAERRQGFIEACQKLQMPLPEDHILYVGTRYEGGKEAALTILKRDPLPDALFFSEAYMVSSTLHWMLMQGGDAYKKIAFVSYTGDSDSEENSFPGISTIRMPMEEMSKDCIRLLLRAIQHPELKHINISHKPITIIRNF